jgi:hypothetical protein
MVVAISYPAAEHLADNPAAWLMLWKRSGTATDSSSIASPAGTAEYQSGCPGYTVDTTGREIPMAVRSESAYYVLLNDHVYFIGGNSAAEVIYLRRVKTQDEAKSLKNTITALTASEGLLRHDDRARLIGRFKIVEVQDKVDQQFILAVMRTNTATDRKERGTFIRLTEYPHTWRVEMDGGFIVGTEQQVPFTFVTDKHGAIKPTDRSGNLLIGTLHLHTHDNGLSGTGAWLDDIESDVKNVWETRIPWVTVGPRLVHIGFINQFDRFVMEDCNEGNLILQTFRNSAVPLGRNG